MPATHARWTAMPTCLPRRGQTAMPPPPRSGGTPWPSRSISSTRTSRTRSPGDRTRSCAATNWAARVLRAFWIQFVLLGLGAAALIAFADLLASQQGTSWVKGLLATAGITGFSVAGLSAKLKNEAQALLLRLRQDAYTDLITVYVTTAPSPPKTLPSRRRAKMAKMARQRSITPVTPN